jgi:hypothetical protein
MEPKSSYIKDIQETVISFNEYWEDPITDSPLCREPKKNAELIVSYCKVLQTMAKNNQYKPDYLALPSDVMDVINKIVNIVSDNRDLRHKHAYSNICPTDPLDRGLQGVREFDHYVEANGCLKFENKWFTYLDRLIEECEKLIECCNSEESTSELTKYEGKILEWEHYESGSYVIRIDQINQNSKGQFTFDGAIMYYATIDSQFDLDGILFQEAEDFPFDELPYFKKCKTSAELAKQLDSGKEKTMKDVRAEMHDAMDSYFDGTFDEYSEVDEEDDEDE